MIRMIQVLCGPERHAILGLLYEDSTLSVEDVKLGVEAIVEQAIADGAINRRCEICDKPVKQFAYEVGVSKEQDWDKAQALAKRLEAEQLEARQTIMAARRAAKN